MEKLFLPAIYLMDRARLGTKFSLIIFIFSIPLVLLSYGFASQLIDGIKETEAEREGLVILERVFALANASQAYRDIKALALTRNVEEYSHLAQKEKSRVEEVFTELDAMDVGANGREKVREHLDEVKASWKQVNADWAGAQGYSNTYSGLNHYISKSFQLMDTVSQVTGISRDPNVETVSLLRLLMEVVPKTVAPMSEARGFGTFGTSLDYLDSSSANKMDEIFDALINVEGVLKQATALTIDSSPYLKQRLGDAAAASIQAIMDMQIFLEEKTILAESLEYPTAQYFEEQSQNIDVVYGLVDASWPVVDGLLAQRLEEQQRQLYILYGALAIVYTVIIYLFGGFYLSMNRSFSRFFDAARKVAAGDLRETISLTARDEVQDLANEFNTMSVRVRELISKVLMVAGHVGKKSDDVEGIAEESTVAIERQISETDMVATAMNEMAATVQDVARNSAETASLANTASQEASVGQQVVDGTLNDVSNLAKEIDSTSAVISRVSDDSDNISNVLEVIKGISAQTNLLALNAAIEAARAGDQGRGFAVVADEVRTLSQRTHKSVEEIETMINRLQTGVADAVSTMKESHEMASSTLERSGKVGDALVTIVGAVDNIVGMTDQIATAAEEQSAIADEINDNILRISEVGHDTEKGAQSTSAATNEMAELVSELQALVNTFKV